MQFKYLISISLFVTLLFSCNKKENGSSENEKELPVLEIIKKDTIVSNQFVADIQAKKNIEVHSRIPGLIEQIFVNEGQFVKKGQKLFKINDAELHMELLRTDAVYKQAEADLSVSEVEVKQLQILFDKQVVADHELDMAKAKRKAAIAKVAQADAEKKGIQQKISFTNIVAPFDGVIDRIPFKEGSFMQSGMLLTTISMLDEVYAYFSIPENLYFELLSKNRIGSHQKIELILPNGETYKYNGTLQTAEGEIDKATGSIQYKVAFPNPKKLIKHGSSGKLIISEEQSDVIIIPQKSTFSIQDKLYVFTVNKDQSVKMTNVKIANTLSDAYIIEDGLLPGDLIVFEGSHSIRDGEKIKTRKIH